LRPSLTIRQALEEGRIASANICESQGSDLQLILADILQQDRTWVLAHPEFSLGPAQIDQYRKALHAYKAGKPLPYILGWWEFYGRRFQLSEDVLIPRPETEHLIDAARQYLADHPERRLALDVGTGSGCIAVTLLAEMQDLVIVATDLSLRALDVARRNAEHHHVAGRIFLVQADLVSTLQKGFDLVCANLPYIPSSKLARLPVSKGEPWLALNGGKDGLDLIGRMLSELPGKVRPGGRVLIELEASQGKRARELAQWAFPSRKLELLQDLAGRERVLAIDL
jgi:release factor glutamine methyltransferase